MPLPSELVYNSLNGEEIKKILCARFIDVLNQIPDFKRFTTFPRVRMEMNIRLEVAGRTPPNFRVADDVVVRMNPSATPPLHPTQTEEELEMDTTVNVNADDMDGGDPPDQIREDHTLPIMTPQRGPAGYIEDVPVLSKRVGAYSYAAFVEQDYGPARARSGQEGSVVGLLKNIDRAAPEVKLANRTMPVDMPGVDV